MVKVIFIDDNYLYQNFPLPKRLERAALLSIIQLEQYTSLQSLIGTCLYEDIEQKVFDRSLGAEEEKLFKLLKYSLAMYAAKATVGLLRSGTAHTKAEEKVQDQFVLDTIISQIESKVQFINKRIVEFVKNNDTMKTLVESDDCTESGSVFEEDDVYQGSVYYPADGVVDNKDCTGSGVTYE